MYLNEKVETPKKSTFAQVVGKYTYLYLTVGSYYNDKHQQRHKQKSLGRIVKDEEGQEWLIPNDNYYEHFNLPKPTSGEVKKPGPARKQPRALQINPPQESFTVGYALAVRQIAQELKLYEILDGLLGPSGADRVLSIAAYYAQCDGNPDLSQFSYFMEDKMAPLFKPFDAKGVLSVFEHCGGNFLESLMQRCNALQDKSEEGAPVLCEAVSISTTSALYPIGRLDYERNPDELEKTNLSVILSPVSRRPVGLSENYGPINDIINLGTV